MTRVGVTGHQRLPDPSAWPWVREQLGQALAGVEPPIIGLSALAAGTDQIFAEMVLDRGGILELVLPFPSYRDVFRDEGERNDFERLAARAARVWQVPAAPSNDAAYLAAGKLVVDHCDQVLAVYDGRVDTSTGDIVAYAKARQRPMLVIDPSRRDVRQT